MHGPATRSFSYEAEAFRSYCQRQFDAPLEYHVDSVALLDGILGEAHASLKGMNEVEAWTYLNNMTLAAGAFLGEVLCRTAAAAWSCQGNAKRLQDWGVQVSTPGETTRWVPCFDAVFQFLHKGPTESLLGVVTPFLASGHAATPKRAKPKKAATPRAR